MNFKIIFFSILGLGINTSLGLTSPLPQNGRQLGSHNVRHRGRFNEDGGHYTNLEVFGATQIKDGTVADAIIIKGSLDATRLKAKNLDAAGSVKIFGGEIGHADIKGAAHLQKLQVNTLEVAGFLAIHDSTVKSGAQISGNVNAISSNFTVLRVLGFSVELKDVTITQKLIITSFTETPIVRLYSTHLTCEIVFVGKAGKVYLDAVSSVDRALITNGEV